MDVNNQMITDPGLKNRKGKQKKEELRMALLFSISLLLFFAISLFFIHRNIHNDIHHDIQRQQVQELKAMSTRIHDILGKMEIYLANVSNLYTVRQILQKEDAYLRKEVEYYFSKLIEVSTSSFSPTFDQVRLLDLNGMEKIRLNLGKDNQIKICPENELQNKSNRYYFRESVGLLKNQFYMSPLDLNVEHGKIEIPHKPMIRFAVPVFDLKGERIGVLIFNYLAQQLFETIQAMNYHNEDQWMLLNEDGYYLHSPDIDKNFGFMFPDSNKGFFSDHPDLWAKLSNSTNEKFIHSDGIFFRKDITPFELDTLMTVSGQQKWTLLMFVPKKNIHKQDELLTRGVFFASVGIAPILFLLGWFLGKSRVKNKYYTQSLEASAKLDGMTKLLNYREALEQLEYQTKVHKRSGQPLSLSYIDLNDLKMVNDSLGHKFGDQMITTVTDAIKNSIRGTDIAARIGGDEFLIIFPNMKSKNTREVIRRIEHSYAQKSQELFKMELTLSWGISYWKGTLDTAEEFINRADKAMYKMKKEYKLTKSNIR